MTSPFPVTPWPADGTPVNKAMLDAKVNAPLSDLDTRVRRDGWGTLLLQSTANQTGAAGGWLGLGWTSPAVQSAGSGLSASPSGIQVDNDGFYMAAWGANMPPNNTGSRRLGAIASSSSSDPASELPVQGSLGPINSLTFISGAGLVFLTGGVRYTLYLLHDATASLTYSRRWMALSRVA